MIHVGNSVPFTDIFFLFCSYLPLHGAQRFSFLAAPPRVAATLLIADCSPFINDDERRLNE